ncbi:MAG: LysM peptidoglycan-binding domain-containing protein [Opitutales bacterium]|nr:LysM peptidoglycan-binding domain-containing protein [Opitutales bacterium]
MDVMDSPEEPISVSMNSGTDKKSIVFGVIGILGLVFGITGIVMANSAGKKVEAFKAEITARPDKSAILEKKVETMERQLGAIADKTSSMEQAVRELSKLPTRTEITKTFNDVAGQIRTNREQLNAFAAEFEKLNKRFSGAPVKTTAPAAATSSSGAPSGADQPAVEMPEEGIYIVQAGDMLGKIASKFHTTVDKLIEANPGIDPRRLQIGQRILIPKE